jgi:hypothetical protein
LFFCFLFAGDESKDNKNEEDCKIDSAMHCESKQSKELLEWEAKVRGYMQILQ